MGKQLQWVYMTTLIGVFVFVTLAGLLIVAAMRPQRTTMSRFELERRADKNDQAATGILHREALLVDLFSLQRIVVALLLVIVTLLVVVLFGWLLGILAAVVIALEYGAVARLGFVESIAARIYQKIEPWLLKTAERFPKFFAVMRSVRPDNGGEFTLESREQLLHLVSQSGDILTTDEKRLVKHALQFEDRLVDEIMTPVSMIDSIKQAELLGPLVLDDLHKTGHNRFPVIDGDINHIVGTLHLRDLLTLDSGKRTTTVAKAMEARVFYIRDDQTLAHALAAFLKTHHHLFVVVNEFRETVGLLTLEDVMEALLGRRIVDEFDTHEDLRVVAARNPRKANRPPVHTDV